MVEFCSGGVKLADSINTVGFCNEMGRAKSSILKCHVNLCACVHDLFRNAYLRVSFVPVLFILKFCAPVCCRIPYGTSVSRAF